MKRIIWILCILCCGLTWAKHNGDYLNTLNSDYETAHYEFVRKRPEKPLRTLFVLIRGGARDAVEIAQRMPMDYSSFLTYNWAVMAQEDMYESTVAGTSVYEKEQALSHLLDKRYDVCVLGSFYLGKLPEEAQYRLLKAVENGMGLVLVQGSPRAPYKKLFRQPLPVPEFVTCFPSKEKSFRFAAYQVGKGRLVELTWGRLNGSLSCLPGFPYGNQWKALHENTSAFMGMVCQYAAGRETVPTEPTVRIRNVWNEDVTGKPLAGGLYFRDDLGSNGVYRISSFKVPSVLGTLTLSVPETVVPGHSFEGVLTLERSTPKAASVLVEVYDSPYRRIWYRHRVPLAAGQKRCAFTVKDYPMPTLAGYVRATVCDESQRPLGVTDSVVFFPDTSLEDYMQLGWDTVRGVNGELLAPQLVDRLGWRLGLTHPSDGGGNIRDMALLNQKLVCYTVRITLMKAPGGGVRQGNWFFLPKEQRNQVKALKEDECFYRPEVQELWRQGIRHRVRNLSKYSTAIYSLGDENVYARDAGYGPSDLKYFRKFLARKYGDISRLNLTYGSGYKTFDEVPHLPLKVALEQKNYAAWADHHAYMETMYADIHAFLREEIRKIDPGARVGAEGSVPGDLEQTIERLEYWGPYSNRPGDELLRSFGGDKLRMLWWGGYPGSHGGRGGHPIPLCRDILLGTVNGNAWFSSLPGSNHSCFDCDFDLADYVKRYLPDLDRLAAGSAQLLIRNPLLNDGVYFYWSHPSVTAQLATGKTISPVGALSPLISVAYRKGLGFDFVSSRTLDRLSSAKILFLCGASALSDEECQAILAFVRRGGMVIADVFPAVMDENLRIRKTNQLAALVGNVTFEKVTGTKPVYRSLPLPGGKAHKARCYGEQVLQRRTYGKGMAILTNFSLSSLANTAMPSLAFDGWVTQLIRQAGVELPWSLEQGTPAHIVRMRQGKDFLLAGLLCDVRDMKRKPLLRLNRPLHAYRVDGGYLGVKDSLPVDFSRSTLALYALFEQVQKAPSLSVADARLGQWLRLELPKLVSGRMLRLDILDARQRKVYSKVFDREAIIPRPALAYTDCVGTWEARLTDVATGLSSQCHFEVKP